MAHQDKKVERGRLTLILVRGIGQAFVAKDVDEGEVLGFLREEMGNQPEGCESLARGPWS